MARKPFTGLTEEQQRLSDLRVEACKHITGRSTPEEVAKAQAACDAFGESMREYYENPGFFEREAGKRAAVGLQRCSMSGDILGELIARAEQLSCCGSANIRRGYAGVAEII